MEKKLTKGDLINIFIRSNFLLGSFNFERMQSIGFCVSMIPALKRLYKGEELNHLQHPAVPCNPHHGHHCRYGGEACQRR